MQARDRIQPLARETLFRKIGPLIGAAFSALIALAFGDTEPAGGGMLIQAATVTSLTVAALIVVPWSRLPSPAQVIPALAYMMVALLIRQATGGAESIYGELALAPILWLAAYGTLAEVAAGIAGTSLLVVSPLVLVPDATGQWPGTLLLLVVTAAAGLGVQQLFHYLRGHADQLAHLARTDPLTGASNRRAWEEDLEAALERASRSHGPLCVALVDLDRFKQYNDANGHQAGDRLLKEVTARWRSQLRGADVLARLGGDEFAVILPGAPLDAAHRILERLRQGVTSDLTCSTGLASWDGAESVAELVARADAALYQAKEAGRNRIVVAA